MDRASSEEAREELERHLAGLFSEATCASLDAPAIRGAWGTVQGARLDKQVKWIEEENRLLVPIVDPQTQALTSGVELRFSRGVSSNELRLAKVLTWVFNSDLKLAPRLAADKELWLSLQQTRFSRAIARYASFKTDVVVRWLRSLENAATLKYEGTSFAMRLLLCAKLSHITSGNRFEVNQLSKPITATKALFGSKWLRALSKSGDINLVAKSGSVSIVGILRPCREAAASAALAPHTSLAQFCDRSNTNTVAFVASSAGDLFVACRDGGTFVKRQGHWHFLNYAALLALVRRHVGTKAELLAQAVLDLSYERKGALFVVPRGGVSPKEIVPDYLEPGRANEELRSFSTTLSLGPDDFPLIKNVAAIDGAVIFDTDGQLLDCSCMVSRPSIDSLNRVGINAVQQFDGARTTAAWNASISGLAIKISEDGPITFWESGKKVLSMG